MAGKQEDQAHPVFTICIRNTMWNFLEFRKSDRLAYNLEDVRHFRFNRLKMCSYSQRIISHFMR